MFRLLRSALYLLVLYASASHAAGGGGPPTRIGVLSCCGHDEAVARGALGFVQTHPGGYGKRGTSPNATLKGLRHGTPRSDAVTFTANKRAHSAT